MGVLTVSILSASLFSFKVFEIHLHLSSPAQGKTVSSNLVIDKLTATETSVDPPTRISFSRGGVGETISGSVARSRNYVLRAKSGQYLSATLSAANGCVVFNTGSPTINFTTATGDNWLAVVNHCGGQSSFDLTVDIR